MVNRPSPKPSGARNAIRRSLGSLFFDSINVVFMFAMLIATLYPFWDVFVSSVSPARGNFGFTLWPRTFDWGAYKLMMSYSDLWSAYGLTLVRTVLTVVLSLLFTGTAAYTLSKAWLPGNAILTGFVLFTMLFSGGLIPYYLLLRDIRLINNFWVLILPGLVGAYNLLIFRNFFRSIPDSLEESAQLDGASWFLVFFKIVLPLSKPVLATVALWVMLGTWNEWYTPTLFVPSQKYVVLQQILRRYIVENNPSSIDAVIALTGGSKSMRFSGRMLQSTTILATSIPILIIYPFVQKYFTSGIMLGSVKG